VYDTKPPIDDTPETPKVQKQKKPLSEERRIMTVGFIVILILAVGAYAVYFFSSSDDADTESDSAGYTSNVDAQQFVDSTQFIIEQPEPTPLDTMPANEPEQRPQQQSANVFAAEDSLVLEAFSNAPVWFSLKMDTTRTERGSLLTNEHRIWKARSYFLITLGDAGAVTFFLNGKEIGTLGEEGAVVKNVMLSRQNL
jgi:hypothetical protein